MGKLTHFDESGNAIMVDVSEKAVTQRCAVASGAILVNKDVFDAIKNGTAKKGDVLGCARIAGIMAAKKTSDVIPLCHPLMLSHISIDFSVPEKPETDGRHSILCTCKTKLSGKTGVEMEALTGVSAALLTIYDMCKAIDRKMEITAIKLLEKNGGRSGHYIREA